jgi:hypothetical protein
MPRRLLTRRRVVAPLLIGVCALVAIASGKFDLNGGGAISPAGIVELPTTPTARPKRTPSPVITASPVPTPAPTESPPPTPVPTPEPTPAPPPEPPPTPEPVVAAVPPSGPPCGGPPYLAWVWHFGVDGSPSELATSLAQHRSGIIMKTHDKTDWMSKWDSSPYAVTGPGKSRRARATVRDRGSTVPRLRRRGRS